jgi:hypothetical protein
VYLSTLLYLGRERSRICERERERERGRGKEKKEEKEQKKQKETLASGHKNLGELEGNLCHLACSCFLASKRRYPGAFEQVRELLDLGSGTFWPLPNR